MKKDLFYPLKIYDDNDSFATIVSKRLKIARIE